MIRLKRSTIGQKQGARRTLFALGLRRVGQSVAHEDTPAVRGMIQRIRHLVEVEERDVVGGRA